jgi:anti-anti-sigma factor
MASQPTPSLPEEEAVEERTVVRFTGLRVSLDEETLHFIRDELFALADEPSGSGLLLDFGNVEYVSGMALGTLVSLHKKLLARGRRMTIRDLSRHVHEVFVVTGLDRLLDLRPTENSQGTSDGCLGFRAPAEVSILPEALDRGRNPTAGQVGTAQGNCPFSCG